MSNPLIKKWEELYGKKEEPKPPRIEEVEETYELPPEWNTKGITTPSVTINPKPPKLVSYDPHSGKDSFLQIAEKVKNKDARVTSVSIGRDMSMMGITNITFEVQVFT